MNKFDPHVEYGDERECPQCKRVVYMWGHDLCSSCRGPAAKIASDNWKSNWVAAQEDGSFMQRDPSVSSK